MAVPQMPIRCTRFTESPPPLLDGYRSRARTPPHHARAHAERQRQRRARPCAPTEIRTAPARRSRPSRSRSTSRSRVAAGLVAVAELAEDDRPGARDRPACRSCVTMRSQAVGPLADVLEEQHGSGGGQGERRAERCDTSCVSVPPQHDARGVARRSVSSREGRIGPAGPAVSSTRRNEPDRSRAAPRRGGRSIIGPWNATRPCWR